MGVRCDFEMPGRPCSGAGGSELSSIDYSRSSSRRGPLPWLEAQQGIQKSGGGTFLDTAATSEDGEPTWA